MKTIFTSLLLLSCLAKLQSQDSFQFPKWYGSGYLGSWGFIAYGDKFYLTTNLSIGRQFNRWVGVGLSHGIQSYNQVSTGQSFIGLGLEYRLFFPKKWVWSIIGGMGYRQHYGTDFFIEYRRGKPRFPFMKFRLGRQFGEHLSLGAGFWVANPEMELWKLENAGSVGSYFVFLQKEKISMPGFAVTLGLSIN